MDASKYVAAKGDGKKISDSSAIRLAIGNALRDMADEIEAGVRLVCEIQTNECSKAGEFVTSGLYIRTALTGTPPPPIKDEKAKP